MSNAESSNTECEKKAAELAFDLTKQFLTLAFAGIAFVVGLWFNTPGTVPSVLLWCVIASFGLSTVLGLGFLMHGVNLLSIQNTYDIYASSLRVLAVFQIFLVLLGSVFLVMILGGHKTASKAAALSIEIKTGQQTITYPIDPNRSITIEIENGKSTITSK
jgi:hypothetical protein